MKGKDLQTRDDIALLVNTFYDKVRAHEALGPIFNAAIDDWDSHLIRLTDFWETNLFFVRNYKGNPLQVHINVDRQFNNTIHQAHFGNWLQLWFETLDSLFTGRYAEIAKARARSMAATMFLRIFNAREHQQHENTH
ncbi:MAG: group III truncated hemoglobin [Roseivirga sp.]|nr:group III truncated hemoglobin [Roseivirga sp.]